MAGPGDEVATPAGPLARRARRRRLGRVLLATVLAIAVLAVGGFAWLGSESALRFALDRAAAATAGRLTVEGARGSLLDAHADRIVWHDGALTVSVDDASIVLDPRSLPIGRVRLRTVAAAHVEVVTEPSDTPPTMPRSLAAPIGLDVVEARLGELVLRQTGSDTTTRLTDLRASARYARSRWTVDTLSLRGAFGTVQAGGSITDAPPFALAAHALLETRVLDEAIAVDASADGDLAATAIDARTVLREASLAAKLRVAPFAPQPLVGVALTVGGLDLARFVPGAPATRLEGRLEADTAPAPAPAPAPGAAPGTTPGVTPGTPPAATAARPAVPAGPVPPLTGTLALRNTRVGALDAGLLPLDSAQTRFAFDGERLRLDRLALAGPPGRLAGSASLRLPGGLPPAAGTTPDFELRLATDALDLARAHGALRTTALSGELRIAPERGGLGVEGRLADAELALSVDARARLVDTTVTIERARLQARDGTAEVTGTAGIATPFPFALQGTVSGLDPARFADVPGGLLDGRWRASGRAGPSPTVDAALTLADSRWRGLALAGDAAARWTPDRVSQVAVALRLGATSLTARGDLGSVGDRLAIGVDAPRLQELDARASGRATLEAELRDGLLAPRGAATVRGRELKFTERFGARALELRGETTAAALQDVLERLGLRDASTSVAPATTTAPTKPAAPATATGRASAPSPDRAPTPASTVARRPASPPTVDRGPPMRVTVEGEALRIDDRTIDGLTATLVGDADRHELSARGRAAARGGVPTPIDASLRVEGGLVRGAPPRWRGRLLEASNAGTPGLRLLGPADLSIGDGDAAAGPLRIEIDGADGARLQLDAASWQDGRLRLAGTLSAVPLRWIGKFAEGRGLRPNEPDALRMGARIDLAGAPGAGGDLRGHVEAYRESGDLTVDVPAADGGSEPLRAGLRTLQARVDIGDARIAATVSMRGDAIGTLRGEARMPLAWTAAGGIDTAVPLQGTLDASLPSLAFTRALAGDAWRFDGALQAKLVLAGTLAAPDFTGRIEGSGLAAEQRELGMKLTDGVLVATLRERIVDIETLRFSSGKGSVRMSGTLRPDDRSEAVLVLERMPIPLGAGQRLLLSGEARATLRGGLLGIRGALRADEGVIELTANNAPSLSRDVVVVRDAAEAAARTRERAAARRAGAAERAPDTDPAEGKGFRILSDLQIDLGDAFRVFGAGVDARLEGRLTLSGRLPDAPRLTGTVKIAQGTYTGFGQKLEIERGTLVFSGPVDNPAIDIVAYRRYLPVEAGVALTGTARTPRIALVSKPDVPEPDKLSWLVLGTGSDTARSGGQSTALQAAAATVLATADPSLAGPGLASSFGLDVLAIRTAQVGSTGESGSAATSAQDSVVTLGKRLTDRLFVSYEQSLRGLQNLVRLQYEITERLSARLRAGTSNAVDLLWTYRYD